MYKEIVKNNFAYYFLRLVLGLVFDVIYFPVWWYSRGTIQVIKGLGNMIANEEKSLALFVWVKNLFRPMYGVRGWDGYLVSFAVRLVQIIVRSIALVVWMVIALVLLIAWLVFPILVISQIFYQLK